MSTLSFYGSTEVTAAGYLDIFTPRPVPSSPTDILYEITNV